MVSVPRLGRVHPIVGTIAVVGVASVAAAALLAESLSTLELAGFALGVLATFPKAFERTRDDQRTRVATSVVLTAAFALLFASAPHSPIEGGLAALGAVDVVVETYNYRTGSSILRLDT